MFLEDRDEIGLSKEFNENSVKKILCDPYAASMLKRDPKLPVFDSNGTKILVIRACKSEKMAEYLLREFNIPVAIYISKEYELKESAAIEFTYHFYKHLFLGETINEALLNAACYCGNDEPARLDP
jgi:hypothetical protein